MLSSSFFFLLSSFFCLLLLISGLFYRDNFIGEMIFIASVLNLAIVPFMETQVYRQYFSSGSLSFDRVLQIVFIWAFLIVGFIENCFY